MASPRVAGDVYVSGADFGLRAVGLAGCRRFDGNQLTGAIPTEMGLLTSLQQLCESPPNPSPLMP